jgi:DNA-binding MarR family transcriptional regulator
MTDTGADNLIDDFLGSVNIFSTSVHELLERQLKDVTKSRITFSQLKLLNLVALTEGHTIGDVAAFLGVSNAAASKAVDRLVRRQLLLREEAAADRRAVRLSVTKAGRQILADYENAAYRTMQTIFGCVSAERLQDTAQLLDQLSVSIVDHPDGPKEVCFRCGIHFRERCLLQHLTGRDCYLRLHRRHAARPPTRPHPRS